MEHDSIQEFTDAYYALTGDLPPWWAVKLANGVEVGAQLATKDGRRCGNAVVIGADPFASERLGKTVWRVGTDAGNTMSLTEEEVDDMFYPPVFCMDVTNSPFYAANPIHFEEPNNDL